MYIGISIDNIFITSCGDGIEIAKCVLTYDLFVGETIKYDEGM